MNLSDLAHTDLIDYLHDHEEDIADSINDFGYLKRLFVEVMGRQPNPSVIIKKILLKSIQKRIKDANTR